MPVAVDKSVPVFKITHELPGRLRFRPIHRSKRSISQSALVRQLSSLDDIDRVTSSPLTGSLLVHFTSAKHVRAQILHIVPTVESIKDPSLSPDDVDPNPVTRPMLISAALLGCQFLFPPVLRPLILLPSCWPFIRKGLISLSQARFDSALLDGAAV